jgi:DNA-binding NarL/FixJ family response regulator
MFRPQVLVFESETRLANLLRREPGRNWLLREPRREESCFRLLRQAAPSVLVICIGKNPGRDLALAHQVALLFPDTFIVVVSVTPNQALEDLAWDLGARYVLFPPQSPGLLPKIVGSLIESFPGSTPMTVEQEDESNQ